MTTVPTRAQGADFTQRHRIHLTAELEETTAGGDQTWRLEAHTSNGTHAVTLTTDGSYTPDPFEVLFGSWADCAPDDDEYYEAGRILGPDALHDLAGLLGWIPRLTFAVAPRRDRRPMTFDCPACRHSTGVELPKSGVVWGSGPPLTIRFDCAGWCGGSDWDY